MDLLDIDWYDELIMGHQVLTTEFYEEGRPLPRQKAGAHRLDREVCNFTYTMLGRLGVVIQVARSAFQEGAPIFPNSAIFDRSHVQVAVRDLDIIQETNLVASR